MTFFLFLLMAFIETSFISSLPDVFVYTPLIFALSIFFIQQFHSTVGIALLFGYGLYLDLFSVSEFPLESLSALIGALVCLVVSEQIFSNRSWYGLIGCGLTSLFAYSLTRGVTIFLTSLWSPNSELSTHYFLTAKWNTFFLVILLTIFFAFSRPLRKIIRSFFMVSTEQETLS